MSALSREEWKRKLFNVQQQEAGGGWSELLTHDADQRAELKAKDVEIARLTAERDEARKRLLFRGGSSHT